jgi:DNA processing protein
MIADTHDELRYFNVPPIQPLVEMGAYEALWELEKASFKTLANAFQDNPGKMPSDLITQDAIDEALPRVLEHLQKAGIDDLGVRIHGASDYPEKLRDATNPIEFLYYRGQWDLAVTPKAVAVVGTRNPSDEGCRRARRLVRLLVDNDFTILSGLAKGIDTIAHTAAMERGGRTAAVMGTPITENYPRENRDLQERLAKEFLIVSQVPILRYARQTVRGNRLFFPERNVTMSALSQATVIVEAGETSGTLIQARAALKQGRKLFILDSCFQNSAITWPAKFEAQGAIRVSDFDDILRALDETSVN